MEDKIFILVCDDNGINCTEEEVDWFVFSFDVTKGMFVGVTAVYSETCRGSLVGLVDSGLEMYKHIEVWLPWNLNKFGLAMNNLTTSSNEMFAFCDISHMYSEFTKLLEWQKWEQYVVLGARVGGVFITDFNKAYKTIETGSNAGDGYSVGTSVGDLVSKMLDSIL